MELEITILGRPIAVISTKRINEILLLMLALFFGFCTSMMIGNLISTMTGVYSEIGDDVWKMYFVTILAIAVYGGCFWWSSRTWLRIRDLRRIQIFEEPWRVDDE